ncbi:MAG: ABC transporter permease [Rhodospirillaceae bacterium]
MLLVALRRHPIAIASALVLLALAGLALAAPLIEAGLGIDTGSLNLLERFAGPSAAHPLGTDELGRDMLARLLEGGRVSLFVGVTAALTAALLGTAVGLPAGYFGGRLDEVLMRLTDGVIALPLLPLLIVLAAVSPEKLGLGGADPQRLGLMRIVVLVALVGWTTAARLVRGTTLATRRLDHIRSAEALGAGAVRIMLVHILPNIAAPLVVATTLSVGNVILLESVLSFLGLGIQPPLPSWGNMLTNAQEMITTAPMLAVWPGLLIFVTVLACNLLGDGLQDALDPRGDRRRR